MGRKSKLSDAQWREVERRMIDGESVRGLSREFGVSEAAIRARKTAQVEQIKAVANQIVATERAVMALPIDAQITSHNLAAKLRAISDSLASSAQLGAATSHRLHALANSEANKIDDAEPLKSEDAIKGTMALLRVANEAAAGAHNLMSANKDQIKKINDEGDAPTGLAVAPMFNVTLTSEKTK